jgi:hypothetical protein
MVAFMKTSKSIKLLLIGIVLLYGLSIGSTMVESAPTSPSYSVHVNDAITGDNQFTSGGLHYWYVNTGADSYPNDVYERPTVQTYTQQTIGTMVGSDTEYSVGASVPAAGGSSPTYYGYIDIVKGHYGYDSQYMYFGIELYSTEKVGDDGTATADFGEGTYYNVRISEDPNGKFGLDISGQAQADYVKTEYSNYNQAKAFGYQDTAGDVGGPNGITTPDEGVVDGFDDPIIADGKLVSNGNDILWTRYTTTTGRPMVEFAFDYTVYNSDPAYNIDPSDGLAYLVYDADRGLKDNQNYLWNDEYSLAEAGTPYDADNQPQNIYELDTVTVPIPGAVWLLGTGLIGLIGLRRKLSR